MSSEKSPDRLISFTDAVVAIALTLLVLPLTDAVSEVVSDGGSPVEVITERQWLVFSFLLSFVVIARLWLVHHRIFEGVRAYNGALMAVNLLWLLTIVVLPVPTELVGGFQTDRFTIAFYLGTILLGSLCQTGMIFIIRNDPAVAKEPVPDRLFAAAVGNSIAFALALLVGTLFPAVGYFSLFLLIFPNRIVDRWFSAGETATR